MPEPGARRMPSDGPWARSRRGESKTYTVKFLGKSSTSNQAVFTSNTFPRPGFVATAWTTVDTTARACGSP